MRSFLLYSTGTFAAFYALLWLADHYPMTFVVGVAASLVFFVGTAKTGDL